MRVYNHVIRATVTVALIVTSLAFASCSRIARERTEDIRTQAVSKGDAGDFQGAIADFSRAIELDPNSLAAYGGRAVAKFAAGDFDGAIADYDRAIQFDPQNRAAFLGRGHVKFRKGDADGAIADYSQVITLAPKHPLAYVSRGGAKHLKGDLDGELVDYDTALDLDPRFVSALVGRGTVKQAKHDTDGAIAAFNRAIQIDPKCAAAYVGRGTSFGHKANPDAAIADFDRAIQLDPNRLAAYSNRGFARAMKGDLDGAAADCDRTLELDPKHTYTFKTRALVHYTARRWEEALRDFKRYCESSQQDQDYSQLAMWLIRARLGETDLANQELANYLEHRPGGKIPDWISTIAGHLLGKVSETELLTAAKAPDAAKEAEQICEARYYAGMKKLLAGDKTAAAGDFEKCIGTSATNFVEYLFAQSELKALGL